MTVQSIDLRPSGLLHSTMTAQQPEMAANTTAVNTTAAITCTEVTPLKRLAYAHLVDFVPGVAPCSTALAIRSKGG